MTHRSLASFATLLALGATAFAQEPKFQSKVIDTATPGHAVEIDVDVTGAKELFLVVRDGGNGFGSDWADWAEPRLVTASGEKKLTDLKWKSAETGWGNVGINKNADGGAMKIAGKPVEYGIGTHANSVIAFDLPAGTTRFKSRATALFEGRNSAGSIRLRRRIRPRLRTNMPMTALARILRL